MPVAGPTPIIYFPWWSIPILLALYPVVMLHDRYLVWKCRRR